MTEDIDEKITQAKVSLMLKNNPFIGALACRLDQILTNDIPTAATDGKRIYYNPDFVKSLTNSELLFVIAHETLHVVYDHVFRRKENMDRTIWNLAVDYIVNYTLVKNKIGTMPKDAVFDEKYTDEYSAEELYEILLKENNIKEYKFDIHLDASDLAKDQKDGIKNIITVSIFGENLSEKDIEDIKREIRNEVKSTIFGLAANATSAGNIPLGIKRYIEKITEPKLDWRDIITNYMKSSIKTDFNFKNPHNLSWVYNFIIPSFDRGEEVNVAIFIDASGSISEKQLREFVTEIKNIAQTFDSFDLLVASFDTQVYNVKKYSLENIDELDNYEIRGGGGTSFECIFNYLKENNIDPKTLVIFTDGYTYDGWGDPNYCDETIFLINNKDPKVKAPFGLTVRYED